MYDSKSCSKMIRVKALNLIGSKKSSTLFQLLSIKRLEGQCMCSTKASLDLEDLEIPNA